MNGLGGRLSSSRLGGTIGCWLLNRYGIVDSLEFDSIATICGSSEATDEVVIVSLAIAFDSCVELKTAGDLYPAGRLLYDERSS